jgi:hypothetical protein
MSKQIPDMNALTPDTLQFLEAILGELAKSNGLTAHMSKKDAVESLMELLKAGFIKLHYDDDAEEFFIVPVGGIEFVTLQ